MESNTEYISMVQSQQATHDTASSGSNTSNNSQEQIDAVANNVNTQGLRVMISGSPFDGKGVVSLVFNILIIYALVSDYDIAIKNNGLYIMLAIRLLLNIVNYLYVRFIASRLNRPVETLRRYIKTHKYIQITIYLWLIVTISLLNSQGVIISVTTNVVIALVFLDIASLLIQFLAFCTMRRNPRLGLRIMSITQLGGYGVGGDPVEIRSLQTDTYRSDKIVTLRGTDKKIALKGADEVSPQCSICLEEYQENSPIKILPCGHFGDTECLDDWLSTNYSCPICRYDIRNNSSQDVDAPQPNFVHNGRQLHVDEVV